MLWCFLSSFFTDPSLDALSADGAGLSTQNIRNWVLRGPENSMPSVRSSLASESINDLIRRGVGNLPEPFAIYQSNYLQIGLERDFLNNGYYRQPEFNQNLHSQCAPPPTGVKLQQPAATTEYSKPTFFSVRLSGLQNGAGGHTMINQRTSLQPNQLSSMYAFQESSQNTSDVSIMDNCPDSRCNFSSINPIPFRVLRVQPNQVRHCF